MRFGYPAINIELSLHSGDPIEFLAGVAEGKPPSTRAMDEVAVGVVLALPPYPFSSGKAEEVVEVPIWGVTGGLEDRLHFCNVCLGKTPDVSQGALVVEGGHLVTSGSYVLVATGTGDSVVNARSKAYRALDRMTIPASPFWRVDIGSRLRSGLDAVQQHGYATGMRYA